MEAIDVARDQKLLQGDLLGVDAVLLYVLIRGRNAWHSTWINNYRGPGDLVADLPAAKATAEDRRGPGNVFYIREVPGIRLKSSSGSLVLAEFHSDNCFGKWNTRAGGDALKIGVPVADALSALGPGGTWRRPIPSEHSFIRGKIRWSPVSTVPPRRPLKRWTSRPVGPRYLLGWSPERTKYSRRGVFAIQRAFKGVNEASVVNEAELEYMNRAEAEALGLSGTMPDEEDHTLEEWLRTIDDIVGRDV